MPPRKKKERPSIQGLTDKQITAMIALFGKLLHEYTEEWDRRQAEGIVVEELRNAD